jgi:hypothetical protein
MSNDPQNGQTKNDRPAGAPIRPDARRPWVSPTLEELPPLTDLTLQTGPGIPGGGGIGGGGSTVIP